jgi:hypothetical protein
LGDAVVRLLVYRPLCARISANARPHAASFSVERMTERTIAVYESVMARATPGAPANDTNSSSSRSVT